LNKTIVFNSFKVYFIKKKARHKLMIILLKLIAYKGRGFSRPKQVVVLWLRHVYPHLNAITLLLRVFSGFNVYVGKLTIISMGYFLENDMQTPPPQKCPNCFWILRFYTNILLVSILFIHLIAWWKIAFLKRLWLFTLIVITTTSPRCDAGKYPPIFLLFSCKLFLLIILLYPRGTVCKNNFPIHFFVNKIFIWSWQSYKK